MLSKLEVAGFKSFAKKTALSFDTPITAIVGPNGSGKSNVVESIRFVLGEQSMKSLRGKGGSDLIWKGSKLLGPGKSARVGITFDNAHRKFAYSSASGASANLDFDEITLSREVTPDGGSNYFINGTSVRLKDITELLNSVNIGASGHHIISQGEADRLLSASSKDRRAMVEDALGLKVFQIRIKDSERKLEKTAQNMKEVQALRRELAPHLNFLSKQVEKIEKAQELRKEFGELFNEYAQKESGSIALGQETLDREEGVVKNELAGIEKITAPDTTHAFDAEKNEALEALRNAETQQRTIAREREELSRSLGRIEGKLDALSTVKEVPGAQVVPTGEVEKICGDILATIAEAKLFKELIGVQHALDAMHQRLSSFVQSLRGGHTNPDSENIRGAVEKEKTELENTLALMDGRIEEARRAVVAAQENVHIVDQKIRDAERNSYKGEARAATLEGTLREYAIRKESLTRRKAVLTDEIREAEVLIGTAINAAFVPVSSDTPEEAAEREGLHRRVERIKIKLEDIGAASGAEVLKEYEETKDRDAFLAKELVDLEASIALLRGLISELRDTIERTFKEGIEKINVQFGEFFKLMFNGGGAFLSISVEHKRSRDGEDDDGEEDALPFEHGVEINVSLPHKKVRDLHMLSGGERSLVSIALLFAMSQVNPPPFLVLDETDAALDEANSRRYGDMLEKLSKHSKLIVVTHNRETMSRAQVLYGVTMGLDGASKLLSIKFDEAVLIAK